MFEDVLLDTLAVIRPSSSRNSVPGTSTLRAGELIIVAAGQLSAAQARHLAASAHDGSGAIALLLAVCTWDDSATGNRLPPLPAPGRRGPACRHCQWQGCQRSQRRPVAFKHSTDNATRRAAAASVLQSAGWRLVPINSMPVVWVAKLVMSRATEEQRGQHHRAMSAALPPGEPQPACSEQVMQTPVNAGQEVRAALTIRCRAAPARSREQQRYAAA